MIDKKSNPVLCKCGKVASMVLIGKESFIPRCNDCELINNSQIKYVFVAETPRGISKELTEEYDTDKWTFDGR